jgi:hypothetical protein
MSGGRRCRCERPNWEVTQRRCSRSAFNGYRVVPSDYSEVHCRSCGTFWRTKAEYVNDLPDRTTVLRGA